MRKTDRLRTSSLTELTQRELDIARLVAQGLRSSTIAETLFIDVKTVEHHLNSVYQKMRLLYGENIDPRVTLARHVSCFIPTTNVEEMLRRLNENREKFLQEQLRLLADTYTAIEEIRKHPETLKKDGPNNEQHDN